MKSIFMTYCLGFLGGMALTVGVIMHVICSPDQICHWHTLERGCYYFGHGALLLAAFIFCLKPSAVFQDSH